MNLKPIIVFRLLLYRRILFIFLVFPIALRSQNKKIYLATEVVTVSWNYKKPIGTVQVINGNLKSIKILKGNGKVKGSHFEFTSSLNSSITIEIENVQNNPGPGATLISIKTNEHPFSFFLRDVTKDFPIYIPDYSVVVLRGSDNRSFAEVELNILSRKLQTKLQKIESEPEESFSSVEKRTLNQTVPTWLGLSRDFRIFQITESMPDDPLESNIIAPKFSSSSLVLSGAKKEAGGYNEKDPIYTMDEYGRFLPAVNRFPSAADGNGFKSLADYVHSKGLKFGIHLMRGVPVEAVKKKCRVMGIDMKASDIY
jgi:hypothetical protein